MKKPKKLKNIKRKGYMKRKVRNGDKLTPSTKLILWLLTWSLRPESPTTLTGKVEWKHNWKQTTAGQEGGTVVPDYKMTSLTSTGQPDECLLQDGKRICSTHIVLTISGKMRNKFQKMKNGNGQCRQNVSLLHWNLGSKMWTRKQTEIEAVIIQYVPDVFVISEANLNRAIPDEECNIAGYKLLKPKISNNQNIYRLVVLIKDNLDFKILDELGDDRLAALWIKIGARGRRPMIIGSVL